MFFRKLYDFLDSENYLSTTKVFSWLQGVLQKVKTNLDGTNDKNEFVISLSETETATFHVSVLKLKENQSIFEFPSRLPGASKHQLLQSTFRAYITEGK